MSILRVDTAARTLSIDDWTIPCVIGRSGAIADTDKREGDGCTPWGRWPVRGVLLRRDRVQPDAPLTLPWRWIAHDDGWSDGADDPAYNRPVRLPHPYSHERLWREDQAYDVIVVLGHNDAPPVPGRGSAIFFHLWVIGADGQPGPTEGCVAISPDAMRRVLALLRPDSVMEIC